MREGIHPNYYQAKVVCNCGNEFVTGSTKEEIHVEICSKCHSLYYTMWCLREEGKARRGDLSVFARSEATWRSVKAHPLS